MTRLRRGVPLCAALLIAGCGARESPQPEANTAPAPATETTTWRDASGLLIHGCEALYADGRCVLGKDGELTLWVPVLDGRGLELHIDGQLRTPEARVDAAGGQRLTLTLARNDASLSLIELRALDSALAGRRWTVRLDPSGPLRRDDTYYEAMGLARKGKQAEALALLETRRVEAQATNDTEGLAQLESGVSRIELSRGGLDAALTATERAYAAATSTGRIDLAASAAARAAYLRIFQLPDYDEARAWLTRIPEDPSAPSAAHYQRGLLAVRLADLRGGERALEDALAVAQRLGRPVYHRQALEMLAQVAALLGHSEQAEAYSANALALALATDTRPCHRASAWSNVGWARTLLAAEGVHDPARAPQEALREAVELFTGECKDPRRAASASLNLAYASLLTNQLDATRETLDGLDLAQLKPWERSWVPLVEGLYWLAREQPARARESFEQAESHALLGDDSELAWRARVGRARVARAERKREAALALFEEAELLLEQLTARVAIDAGRELFLAGREEPTRAHIELALEAGQPGRAACVAARALARPQRMLQLERRWAPGDERLTQLARYREGRAALEEARQDDWTLSRASRARLVHQREAQIEALHERLDATFSTSSPPPSCAPEPAPSSAPSIVGDPGALELIAYPLPDPDQDAERGQPWAVFWGPPGAVPLAARVELPRAAAPRILAEALLAPSRGSWPEPASARPRLHLVLAPLAQAFDFEGASVEGLRLSHVFDLAYGAGTPPGVEPSASASRAPRALVVADSRGDLHYARREAELVVETLRAAGWAVQTLEDEAATAQALAAALPDIELFHYAGHAEPTGIGGWDSRLVLAEGEPFDVRDILALPRAPTFVILSGCGTGARPAQEAEQTQAWTLAEAFVGAGARAVIASRSIIADEHAATMSRALLEHLDLDDGPGTLARARAALESSSPSPAWADFRAWVPTPATRTDPTQPAKQ